MVHFKYKDFYDFIQHFLINFMSLRNFGSLFKSQTVMEIVKNFAENKKRRGRDSPLGPVFDHELRPKGANLMDEPKGTHLSTILSFLFANLSVEPLFFMHSHSYHVFLYKPT